MRDGRLFDHFLAPLAVKRVEHAITALYDGGDASMLSFPVVERACSEGARIVVDYAATDPGTIDDMVEHTAAGVWAPLTLYHSLDDAKWDCSLTSVAEAVNACRRWGMQITSSDEHSGVLLLCQAFGESLAVLTSDQVFQVSHHEEGNDATLQTLTMAGIDTSAYESIFRVISTGGIPVSRTLDIVDHASGATLLAALTSEGALLGGKMTLPQASLPDGNNVMTRYHHYFSRNFSFVASMAEAVGDRAAIMACLRSEQDRRAREVSEKLPLRVAVMEESIDIIHPGLIARLALDSSAVAENVRRESIDFSVFRSTRPGYRAAEEVTGTGPDLGRHGALVASILASSGTNTEIMLLPSSLVSPGHAKDSAKKISSLIADERVKVVNISTDFYGQVFDCEKVFGAIFAAGEETTLFVVAAGNDGSSRVRDVCPAGIGHRFKNVIVVGGTENGGKKLHQRSNFGREFVDIAAPFCVDPGKIFSREEKSEKVCGTSFAAPVVSGMAATLWQETPELSPGELKQQLLAQCVSDNDLDVKCGGELVASPGCAEIVN